MKKIFIPIVLFGLIFISCSKDNNSASQQEGLLTPVYGKDISFSFAQTNFNKVEEPTIQLIDVVLDIGRKSRDCRGIGVCKFRVCVPKCMSAIDLNKQNVISGKLKLPLNNKNSSTKKTMKIYLNNSLDSSFDSNFYIDSDMVYDNFILSKGVYKLDPSLGEYGGYEIPLEIN